jgi:hypothetical protein
MYLVPRNRLGTSDTHGVAGIDGPESLGSTLVRIFSRYYGMWDHSLVFIAERCEHFVASFALVPVVV